MIIISNIPLFPFLSMPATTIIQSITLITINASSRGPVLSFSTTTKLPKDAKIKVKAARITVKLAIIVFAFPVTTIEH